jgi:mannose-6-phosphate isomerase-like protein (cupin superfamily)
LAIAALSRPALTQAPTVDHWTQSQLLEKEKALKQAAVTGDGTATIKLSEYPNHFTMLTYKTKNGTPEMHEKFADFFYVVHGSATLLTGGKLVSPVTASPGEIHGSSLEGGKETVLREGDFVHIPPNVPHQLIIGGGQDFCYYIIKVREQ